MLSFVVHLSDLQDPANALCCHLGINRKAIITMGYFPLWLCSQTTEWNLITVGGLANGIVTKAGHTTLSGGSSGWGWRGGRT